MNVSARVMLFAHWTATAPKRASRYGGGGELFAFTLAIAGNDDKTPVAAPVAVATAACPVHEQYRIYAEEALTRTCLIGFVFV